MSDESSNHETVLPWDFGDLRAMVVNCTLKPSPGPSHPQGLLDRSIGIMARTGIAVDVVRAVDHDLPHGVPPDMRAHGVEPHGWPDLSERGLGASTVLLGTPNWVDKMGD